jgi:hypothetical protein
MMKYQQYVEVITYLNHIEIGDIWLNEKHKLKIIYLL